MSALDTAQHLFAVQPTAEQLSLEACQWAVCKVEDALQRPLTISDLQHLGTHIMAPLLLLASTQAERAFKWRHGYRQMVALELLQRLKDERGQVNHD